MTDDELIIGISRKDERVWKIFFNTYYDSLFRHAYRILGEEKAAEDIVQEIFISLWDNTPELANGKVLTAYLYRSVTNRSLNHIRNKNREDERLSRWMAECDPDTRTENTSEAEFTSAVREEVFRRLQELILQLPHSRRKIILMSMEGKSGETIARELGISITTVKQQKYRAYNFLRRQLGEYGLLAMLLFLP